MGWLQVGCVCVGGINVKRVQEKGETGQALGEPEGLLWASADTHSPGRWPVCRRREPPAFPPEEGTAGHPPLERCPPAGPQGNEAACLLPRSHRPSLHITRQEVE